MTYPLIYRPGFGFTARFVFPCIGTRQRALAELDRRRFPRIRAIDCVQLNDHPVMYVFSDHADTLRAAACIVHPFMFVN